MFVGEMFHNFYYARWKCQLSTAEMNSRRAVDMLENFY